MIVVAIIGILAAAAFPALNKNSKVTDESPKQELQIKTESKDPF